MRKLRNKIVISVILGSLLSSSIVFAELSQPTCPKTLTLRDAVLLAVRNNPDVRSVKLQRVIDEYSLAVARNEFYPQYTFNARGEVVSGGDPTSSIDPSVKLKTAIGTEIELGARASYINDQNTSGATLSVRQPLLRGFGRDVTLASLRNALDNEQISRLMLRDQVQTTVTKVVEAYYKIVEDYNRLDVDKSALEDSLQTLKTTQLRIKTGKLAAMESTQQEAQVSDLRFSITQDNNTISRDYQDFLILLGLNPKAKLNIVRSIPNEEILVPDLKRSICTAMEKNIGYVKEIIGYSGVQREVVVAKNDQLWRLDLIGLVNRDFKTQVQFNDQGTQNLYTEKRLSAELEIPINDLSRKQKLVNANIGLQKYKIALADATNKLETEVVNAIRDLSAQKHQIETAERSVTLSEQSLHIAQRKFEFGRTTMFEITSLRNTLTQKQNELIHQRISYLTTLAEFQQTLGITLDKWQLKLAC